MSGGHGHEAGGHAPSKSHGPSHSVTKGVCGIFAAMYATAIGANSFDSGGGGGGGHDHGHH